MSSATDHLANERTYLAWLRTAFSLVSLGFATNRFSQFIAQTRPKDEPPMRGFLLNSERFGLGMVVFGTTLIVISALHYFRNEVRLEKGSTLGGSILILVVTVLACLFGLVGTGLLLTR